MAKCRLIILASLMFLQMCRAIDVYYLDENERFTSLYKVGKDSGFDIDYLYDPYSGLLDLDHTDNNEYYQHFDGYYSIGISIFMESDYQLESFKIIITDVETDKSLKEDCVYYDNKIPIEKYSSVEEIIELKKENKKINFDILYSKEKMKNVETVLVTIRYAFCKQGEIIHGEFKKEIYRKSKFKLG